MKFLLYNLSCGLIRFSCLTFWPFSILFTVYSSVLIFSESDLLQQLEIHSEDVCNKIHLYLPSALEITLYHEKIIHQKVLWWQTVVNFIFAMMPMVRQFLQEQRFPIFATSFSTSSNPKKKMPNFYNSC